MLPPTGSRWSPQGLLCLAMLNDIIPDRALFPVALWPGDFHPNSGMGRMRLCRPTQRADKAVQRRMAILSVLLHSMRCSLR